MKRLIEKTVFSGFVDGLSLRHLPDEDLPSFVKPTTEA